MAAGLQGSCDGEEMFVRSSLLLAGLVGVGAATGGRMKERKLGRVEKIRGKRGEL